MATPTITPDAAQQAAPQQNAPVFVGREALRAKIQDFLKIQNRIVVFVAPPGVGKTAFIQALEREHSSDQRPYIAHYCDSSDGANPFVFCSHISQQIQSLLGPDFELSNTARQQQVTIQTKVETGAVASGGQVTGLELHIGGMHPREAFRQLVSEPLRAYQDKLGTARPITEPIVIMVDALDRAWDWDNGQGGNIVSILSEAQDLPSWVSVICTSRPGPAAQALQSRAGVRVETIDPLGSDNLADVHAFLQAFLGALTADDRSALDKALATDGGLPDQAAHFEHFVAKVVDASQGSFLFVRRYTDAIQAALEPGAAVDLTQLVQIDASAESLTHLLDVNYAAVFASVSDRLQENSADADDAVLAMLAIAYGPANAVVINRVTGRSIQEVEDSLARLAPLLAPRTPENPLYRLYHSGFADYYRRNQLQERARDWNMRAAQLLHDNDEDQDARIYSQRYRWMHLRRALRLTWPTPTQSGAPVSTPINPTTPLLSIAQVQNQVQQPVLQAQVLRNLAAQALEPAFADVPGSWKMSVDYLRTAIHELRHSRVLNRRNRTRYATNVPPEALELEQTYTALGNAYVIIGQYMDPHFPAQTQQRGMLAILGTMWDALARLPLTLFLIVVLLLNNVRELHLRDALKNLGRGQDWTVARLYVFAVAAYRRAQAMAQERDDDESTDDITERLAWLYTLMGAYDAAAAAYATLMARPAALARQWHQAVWRLELGEVLLAKSQYDQAIDMFSSARLTFEAQATASHLARTLTGQTAAYYHQGQNADQRGDIDLATTLYNQSIGTGERALDVWKQVVELPMGSLGQTDSRIGISVTCHKLWRISHDQRLDHEQRERARQIIARIEERRFPQRFEHPILRFFRLFTTLTLPVYVIAGLLLAVQLPNRIQIQSTTEIAFQPPQINLSTFPDTIIGNREIVPTELSDTSLAALTTSGLKLRPRAAASALDSLSGNTRLHEFSQNVFLAISLYYLGYLIFGIIIIVFSSPEQFQNSRPGQFVLKHDQLSWRGAPGQSPILDFWASLHREVLMMIARLRGKTVQLTAPKPDVLFTDVDLLICADLQILNHPLDDFSYTIVRTNQPDHSGIVLEGTLVHYEELRDELKRQLAGRHRRYDSDLVRSGWGIVFCLALVYTISMLILLRFMPNLPRLPIANLSYSLGSLYALIAPALILPILWWFVRRPLGISHARDTIRWPLVIATSAGIAIALGVLFSHLSLSPIGLKPDLALPTVAVGVLCVVAYYARPHRNFNRIVLIRAILASAAIAVALVVSVELSKTILWYDALVQGSALFERAANDRSCNAGNCADLRFAASQYERAIALDREDNSAYSLRGLVSLTEQRYEEASRFFARALIVSPSNEEKAIQLSNIAVAETLTARASINQNGRSVSTKLPRDFEDAIGNYARALKLLDARFADTPPTCADLMKKLVVSESNVPWPVAQPIELPNITKRVIVSQLADTCFNYGVNQILQANAKPVGIEGNATAIAWQTIAAAAFGHQAVAASASDPTERHNARSAAAAAWLELSQFANVPQGMPDRRTAATLALRQYQLLQADPTFNDTPSIAAGAAWASIQLGAWDSALFDPATPSLISASRETDDPTFPALHGLIRWFDSTQYTPPTSSNPSPEYSRAIIEALNAYDRAIEKNIDNADQALVIRSMLTFSLRNSPRGGKYVDDDYGYWMERSIRDMDTAIARATQMGRPESQIAGLRYWRGRLELLLALTWQKQWRGSHDWDELVPLYSRAYEDFSTAVALDANTTRANSYTSRWIPWSRALLNNASHFSLSQAALNSGNIDRAISELQLIDVSAARSIETQSSAQPQYSYTYAILRVLANRDLPFPNTMIISRTQSFDSMASFSQALNDTERDVFVTQRSNSNSEAIDARQRVYRSVLVQLDMVEQAFAKRLTTSQRTQIGTFRALITARLQALPSANS